MSKKREKEARTQSGLLSEGEHRAHRTRVWICSHSRGKASSTENL